MNKSIEIENAIIRMGDIAVIIKAADDSLSEGNPESVERAMVILNELFTSRYSELRTAFYGGGGDE